MEEHCPEHHGCYLIDRSCLKPQKISGTPWDKVAVALKKSVLERKIYQCVFDGNFKQKCEDEIGSDLLYEEGEGLQWTLYGYFDLYLDNTPEKNKTGLHFMNSD